MGGLGAGLALAGGGAVDELHTLIAERLAQQKFAELQRAAQADEAFRQQQLEEQMRLREQQQEMLNEERQFRRGIAQNQLQLAEQAATERQAGAIAEDTAPGADLLPNQVAALHKAGRGNLVKLKPIGLQAPGLQTQLGGGSATVERGPAPDMGGTAFKGTAGQLQAADAAKRAEAAAAIAERRAADAERRTDIIAARPVGGGSEPLVAIVGEDGNPVLVPRSQAAGMKPFRGTNATGRPVTTGDTGRLAELDTSLDDVGVLKQTVSAPGATGTRAKAGAMVPNWVTEATGFGVESKQKQAVIDRVKQVIGKALEGGVLRKEDEYKYEKILPTIGDTPAVVKTKLAGLEAAIRQRKQRQLEALADAGYDVSKFEARTPKKDGAGADPLGLR